MIQRVRLVRKIFLETMPGDAELAACLSATASA
jgi:hypothetical protein